MGKKGVREKKHRKAPRTSQEARRRKGRKMVKGEETRHLSFIAAVSLKMQMFQRRLPSSLPSPSVMLPPTAHLTGIRNNLC